MVKGETKAKASETPPDVRMIPIDAIDQGDQLIRADQNDDDIAELALDIQAHGLMQPIGVTPTSTGRYQLLWGARRWLAHKRLHARDIAAHVIQTGTDSVRATAARENLLRRDLSLTEEVDVVSDLHTKENKSPDQIASLLSKSRAWVLRRLSVPALPIDLRTPVLDGSLAVGAAESIAKIDDPGIRTFVVTQARATNATVADVRAMVASILATPTMPAAIEAAAQHQLTQHPAQTILVTCAACDKPKPLDQLAFIRVCAGGCTHPTTTETSADDTPHAH